MLLVSTNWGQKCSNFDSKIHKIFKRDSKGIKVLRFSRRLKLNYLKRRLLMDYFIILDDSSPQSGKEVYSEETVKATKTRSGM